MQREGEKCFNFIPEATEIFCVHLDADLCAVCYLSTYTEKAYFFRL